MPLRIVDIINTPELRTRMVSGETGRDRLVRWAHVCELPDPTEWLGDGDLLMTTGIGIPVDPLDQTRYVEALAQAGLAGMMIGENMQAPSNLDALEETAERLGFPLLLTQYGVPFASVTKAIVDATRAEEFERRNAIARVCISARMAIEGLELEALLLRLEKDVHAGLSYGTRRLSSYGYLAKPSSPRSCSSFFSSRNRTRQIPSPSSAGIRTRTGKLWRSRSRRAGSAFCWRGAWGRITSTTVC